LGFVIEFDIETDLVIISHADASVWSSLPVVSVSHHRSTRLLGRSTPASIKVQTASCFAPHESASQLMRARNTRRASATLYG
ncbi:hypothetical protein, partial [Nocardia pseudovaccinii]|uniref:hypothetical protein n=1 Tax=Nocardia pseudovaccinii TaxID=189540 RepID=UPI001C3FB3AD